MTNEHPLAIPIPKKLLEQFAGCFFDRKNHFLAAVRQFGSPLYVLEPEVLKIRADQFQNAFDAVFPHTGYYYAMKSNNLPYVSRTLLEKGFGLDVSSGAELQTALDLGAHDIVFSGPGKTDPELELAVDHCESVTILMDSVGECHRLKAIAAKKQARVNVGIRLNCNPEGLWRKFGVLPEDLLTFYTDIRNSRWLQFKGLQFHSSWNLYPDRQAGFIHELGRLLETMPQSFLAECAFIDIGGGYWPSQGEWMITQDRLHHEYHQAASIEDFAACLGRAFEQAVFPLLDCRICFEPGRWVCNDAMHILLQVVDKKAHDLVITDAGTNMIGWERFEVDYFPVLNLSQPALDEKPCHILGSLCTPHDVWGYAYFGRDIQEKDVLMIPTQGAYTYSLKQQFIKPLPKVVIMDPAGTCQPE